MYKTRVTLTYRIEDQNGEGLFQTFNWGGKDLTAVILDNFSEITSMSNEFDDIDDLSVYFCAFKDLNQLLRILPIKCLKFLEEHGFSLVQVKGKFVEGDTQLIFKRDEVSIKKLKSDKLMSVMARNVAMDDMKDEFPTLNISNYIILD